MISSPPRIAFCTTCKGRAPHVERALPKNISDNSAYQNAVFVVVDYNSQDNLVEYLRSKHARDIDSGRLVVYSYRGQHAFRMAHAKNIAHRAGIDEGADILVNMDADNFTGPDFAGYIADHIKDSDTYMWCRMINGVMDRGVCGRIVVPRDVFLKTGGYNECYETWGHDDKEFHARIKRLESTGLEIDAEYLHAIRHNDKIRFREYPEQRLAQQNSTDGLEHIPPDTIANYGKIGCGVLYRNFGFDDPVEFKPLPTRIFCVGMHKTATCSLHKALGILGYDSAHWKTAHWAKKIWREIRTIGRSLTLEKHYALGDLPIPALFRQLDKAYPGSKFILTVRKDEHWVESVRKHWDPRFNKWRSAWDTDPFSHQIHQAIYGRKDFDRETFLRVYREHNAAVMDYFKDRPGDMLIMDMTVGDGWEKLCGFLGRPIPTEPYPREYFTQVDFGESGHGI
jgi:hypothetical protein